MRLLCSHCLGLHCAGYQTWVTNVVKLFQYYKMGDCTEVVSLSTKEAVLILKEFKKRWYVSFVEKWKLDLVKCPILRTYRLFKTEFGMESYLKCIKDFKLRRCLSQFRMSSHTLEIERGRHSKVKVPEQDRLCKFCNIGAIENESHFLLHCCRYMEERITLFTLLLQQQQSTILIENCDESFINIMNVQDEKILFSICKYIQKCFKMRNNDSV